MGPYAVADIMMTIYCVYVRKNILQVSNVQGSIGLVHATNTIFTHLKYLTIAIDSIHCWPLVTICIDGNWTVPMLVLYVVFIHFYTGLNNDTMDIQTCLCSFCMIYSPLGGCFSFIKGINCELDGFSRELKQTIELLDGE